MKVGIIGLPSSGKTTLFNALTRSAAKVSAFGKASKDPNLATLSVPDHRVDRLSEIYRPKKTTYAQVQYVDVAGGISAKDEKSGALDQLLKHLRPVDALVHVVRNFDLAGQPPRPQQDLEELESELVFSDLIIVERRIERLRSDIKKGKKADTKEIELLEKARAILDQGKALRIHEELVNSPLLKGYAFLSAKPCIVVLNSGDDVEPGTTRLTPPQGVPLLEIKGKLEMELSQLSEQEAKAFRDELGLSEPATNQLIRISYDLLGLISFFTVGQDEVRAWNIRKGTIAQKAAGTVHSDMERGFIRAEVVHYDDLIELGSHAACQKAGKVRLEGKEYVVRDGDIINFRFNV